MSELMNIMLKFISESQSELSLIHERLTELTSIAFYMNDLFNSYSDFESQIVFFQGQFFS